MTGKQSSISIYLKAALGVCIVVGLFCLIQILGLVYQAFQMQNHIAKGLATSDSMLRIFVSLFLFSILTVAFLLPVLFRRKTFLPTYFLILGAVLAVLFGATSLVVVLQPLSDSMSMRGGGTSLLLAIFLATTCVGIWLMLVGSNREIRALARGQSS